jgi:hypothetical protein
MLGMGAVVGSVLGLIKANGGDVETDMRSSSFGKIKLGNTRLDTNGGFSQYVTLAARLATNQTKTAKGEVKTLGDGYRATTRKDIAEQFVENKFAPVPGFVRDYLQGTNPVGEPFDAKSNAAKMFVPLFVQDVKDVYDDQGAGAAAALAIPGVFGVGLQTYDSNAKHPTVHTQPTAIGLTAEEFMKGQPE